VGRRPGKIEKGVIGLLELRPWDAFTVTELAEVCYPGLIAIERKHRVSILQALHRLLEPRLWIMENASGPTSTIVIYNSVNLHSYAVGRIRAQTGDSRTDSTSAIMTSAEAEAMLLGEFRDASGALGQDKSHWVRIDGPYPTAVEWYRAILRDDLEQAASSWTDFEKKVTRAVHLPDSIVGEIHPDFLKDCRRNVAVP
jgi:hypothetical protein